MREFEIFYEEDGNDKSVYFNDEYESFYFMCDLIWKGDQILDVEIHE